MTEHLPPRPPSRPDTLGLFGRIRAFRRDIFASQPERLYRAWMAQMRGPGYQSFLVNQPDLVRLVLQGRPGDFPKSGIIGESLRALLGRSVFVTNGAEWARQRALIDPAFEGGRLRDTFGAMQAAVADAVQRLEARAGDVVETEFETAHLAADIIFRTLFSIPITHQRATEVFDAFRSYQEAQPLWNLTGLLRLPAWVPRRGSRAARLAAGRIRTALAELVSDRQAAIAAGTAPDDLASKIMTARDPQTGAGFDLGEMTDQVAIFFLAGHETSASALAWALYLCAHDPLVQDRVRAEAQATDPLTMPFSDLSRLPYTRDVFRETLRLYPPVPMMVRETTRPERFRDREVKPGALVILSPWHMHRHQRLWDRPDAFDPGRWQTEAGRAQAREAYIPFSAGPRVCTGAGFAMAEGVLALAAILARYRVSLVPGAVPRPVARLTVRAQDGIALRFERA